MEECTVIGIRFLSYTNNSGRQVNGYRLYYTYPSRDVDGLACDVAWLPGDSKSLPHIGESITLHYNKYGRVVDWSKQD